MAEPRVHEPKLRALHAYAGGRLGAKGRARVERHLAACDVCREALAGLRHAAALLDDARDARVPELDWARIEPALAGERAALARKRRVRTLVVPIALAAAACLAVLVARSYRAPATVPVPRAHAPQAAPPARVAPEPRALALRLTAIEGVAYGTDPAGRRAALGLEAQPAEGWLIETDPDAELHLAIEQLAAIALPAGSRLRIVRAREREVELLLERGRVTNKVQPLVAGARYEIAAAGYRVAVRGTHFSVEVLDSGLGVQVDEGVVAVSKEGALIEELRAPRRWRAGAASPGVTAAPAEALALPRGLPAAALDWPALELPAWPRALSWEIDGTALPAAGELRMRVPPGTLELAALLRDGRRVQVQVVVDPLGSRFDPRGLKWSGTAPLPGAAPAANLDPAQAAAVIRTAQPELQRCYERSLREQGPENTLRMRMRLSLDARGAVRGVELTADTELPGALRDCIRATAGRLHFAAPGGAGIAFEAPLTFHPRR